MDLVQRLRDNAGPGGEWGEYADSLQKEAAAELDRLRIDNERLAAWARVIGEETVLAGYPGGDRDKTLRNIRAMRSDAERLRSENAELLKALEHQRTALLTVRDRQGGHVCIEDLNKGIKQLDAAIAAAEKLDPDGFAKARAEHDELERLRSENERLADWARGVMEETVLAGYPGGDRDQTLRNIRDMRADAGRMSWLSNQTKEASIRFDDGTFKTVKAWSIAATFDDLRTAIDAAMANHSEPVQNPQP